MGGFITFIVIIALVVAVLTASIKLIPQGEAAVISASAATPAPHPAG